jgi:Mg-chelatase subunit ChlD
MAALVGALDNLTPTQIGENCHLEYGWSNKIQEKILQFSFQLTRTDDLAIKRLQTILNVLLDSLTHTISTGSLPEKEVATGYLSILYRMIGQTRDIIDGKGEYMLTYMMIFAWYQFYPELAIFALQCLVKHGDTNDRPYGSWKDMKYFCDFCVDQDVEVSHPLVQAAIKLTNDQLRADCVADTNGVSLAAKWVPREGSSFGWLYQSLATDYFSEYVATAKNDDSLEKAILKAKTEYRKILSSLNRKIDTLQIKQCGGNWAGIQFDKVTSISIAKQKKAFLNIKKNGAARCPDNSDRVTCAENFAAHVQASIDGGKEIKGHRVSMADFTKQALALCATRNQVEVDLLNSQWRDSSSLTGDLGKMIAMVDVSGSMSGDPLYAAVALGIRIAETSVIGKRVMTFSANPTWVNLDGHDDFLSQVETISKADWGMNTNFHAALNTILDAIIQSQMPPEDVQDMVLVVLSDMQMDSGDKCDKQVLYDTMKAKYEAAGIRVHGKPYKPPHILFWNLRSTSGFPTLSTQPNCSMMSGFSPSLLNIFCEQGITALQSCTPWSVLEKSIENKRYNIMGSKFSQIIGV